MGLFSKVQYKVLKKGLKYYVVPLHCVEIFKMLNSRYSFFSSYFKSTAEDARRIIEGTYRNGFLDGAMHEIEVQERINNTKIKKVP